MKIVDDEVPEGEDIIWVCGSNMPPPTHPMFGQAVEGECQYCRSKIVYNKSTPDTVTKLCMTCAHLAHDAMVQSGDTPEVVMRAKDKDAFVATHGGKDFEKLSKLADNWLKNGPPTK